MADDLTPGQQAAAYHGLAMNRTVPPQDRLAMALRALDIREAEVAELARAARVLAEVGRMYLTALDEDPENEYLTLPEAFKVTMVREALVVVDARGESGIDG